MTLRSVYRLSPTDDDWQRDLKAGFEVGSFVFVDDLDKYDERFRKTLFRSVAERQARIFATSCTFDGRLARLWEKALGAANVLRLAPLDQRLEDVREFLRRWLSEHRLTQVADSEMSETVDLIASLRLPRGFIDLSALLQHLASKEYVFSQPVRASAWVDSYRNVLDDSKATSRVILVEGETDAVYFRWVAELALDGLDPDLSIEACGSAAKVIERSIAYRNEGRIAVALFDFDRLGRKYYDDLHGWGHPCVTMPGDFDPLRHGAPDHVLQVVEIEDLLPTRSLERFFQEFHRSPELEISLPEQGLKRLVPHADDKLEIAKWVAATLRPAEADKLLKVYNALRALLSLPPLSFPTPS